VNKVIKELDDEMKTEKDYNPKLKRQGSVLSNKNIKITRTASPELI